MERPVVAWVNGGFMVLVKLVIQVLKCVDERLS